jgi:hypothetical protein
VIGSFAEVLKPTESSGSARGSVDEDVFKAMPWYVGGGLGHDGLCNATV